MPGFHFGRYDIRCWSLEELYAGKGIKILELNGAGAEPGHIYDPQFPFQGAYQVLFHHWNVLYQISRANYQNGTAYMSAREAWQTVSNLRSNRKLMKEAEPSYLFMNYLLLNFLAGAVVSFLGSLPVGILNVSIVQISLQKGPKAALLFAFACAVIELGYSYIAVRMTSAMVDFASYKYPIQLFSVAPGSRHWLHAQKTFRASGAT